MRLWLCAQLRCRECGNFEELLSMELEIHAERFCGESMTGAPCCSRTLLMAVGSLTVLLAAIAASCYGGMQVVYS